MSLRKNIWVICCGIAVFALISKVSHAAPVPAYYREVMQSFEQLKEGMVFPNYLSQGEPRQRDKEFDVMRYFDALTHLSMTPNMRLDYVYHFDGMGGFPILYARPENVAPFETVDELAADYRRRFNLPEPSSDEQRFPSGLMQDYLGYILLDGSDESFFEFLILRMFAGQFYLFWHSGYYDTRLIYDRESLEHLLSEEQFGKELPTSFQEKARSINVTPQFIRKTDRISISVVTFTNWGGLFRKTYDIATNTPYVLLNESEEQLIEYDCGVVF